MIFRLLLVLPLVVLAGAVRADVVSLANGDRLSGTVSSISGGSVLLETELFGALPIPADQVVSIVKDGEMVVRTAAGNELTGVFAVADDQQVLQTDTGIQPISIAELDRAVEDNIAATDLGTDWISRLDLGYVLSTGNSETESSAINFESILNRGNLEHRAFVNWNQDEADGETTRNQLDSGYGLRWYFQDKWFAAANLGYFQDELKEIDQRITVGLGLGYQFFDHSLASFSTELGVTQVFEDLAGESESNPALRWAADYRRWIQPERVEYFYGHEVLSIFDDGGREVYKANTGVRFMLSDFWSAHARIDAVHESDPPEDREKTDLIYTIGFGFTF